MMFHPEVVHTPDGGKLLANFVRHVCGCAGDWTMGAFRAAKIAEIREQVGSGKVICGLSGGVDSAVAAVLIHEAIGEQLTCVFVDHGLMRHGRGGAGRFAVPQQLQHPAGPCGRRAATSSAGSQGVTDPEAKRKFIGGEFINVFEAEAKKIGGADFLAQGTLYPDVIESVSFTGGPVGDDQEPPQCRRAARADEHEAGRAACANCSRTKCACSASSLALPTAFVGRHPFPGPGLAIRIPGEVTKERCDILRKADAIYLEEIRLAGLYDAIWQAFAVLLPVRTVGVMGDARTYDYVCALARGDQRRWHDRRRLSVRSGVPEPRGDAHRQRSRRHQPRGLRLYVEAAGHDRVGVSRSDHPGDGRAGSLKNAAAVSTSSADPEPARSWRGPASTGRRSSRRRGSTWQSAVRSSRQPRV